MMKIHALILIAVLGSVASVGAREPSEACAAGEVTPSTTPAGIGVRQAGDPYQDPTSLYVCSRTVAPGALWVRADTENSRLHVIADGDSVNRTNRCSDGYAAARADSTGARLYRADDGNYSFSSGGVSTETFVAGIVACAATIKKR